jgi:4-hydroxymandelate oxidase
VPARHGGSPALWGLAGAGERGVTRLLTLLLRELDLAMALCGCPTVSDITHALIAHSPGHGHSMR